MRVSTVRRLYGLRWAWPLLRPTSLAPPAVGQTIPTENASFFPAINGNIGTDPIISQRNPYPTTVLRTGPGLDPERRQGLPLLARTVAALAGLSVGPSATSRESLISTIIGKSSILSRPRLALDNDSGSSPPAATMACIAVWPAGGIGNFGEFLVRSGGGEPIHRVGGCRLYYTLNTFVRLPSDKQREGSSPRCHGARAKETPSTKALARVASNWAQW